jgi:hypothetical protein
LDGVVTDEMDMHNTTLDVNTGKTYDTNRKNWMNLFIPNLYPKDSL